MLCHYVSIVEFIASELFRIQFSDDVFTNSLILTLQREFYPMEAGSKIRLDNEDHMFYPNSTQIETLFHATELKTLFKLCLEKHWHLGMKPDA